MDIASYDRDDLARRAKNRYERRIREPVEAEPANEGRFVAVDVDSGDYEVADDALGAGAGLRRRRSGASVYLMRVGPADGLPARRLRPGHPRVRPLPTVRGNVAEDYNFLPVDTREAPET